MTKSQITSAVKFRRPGTSLGKNTFNTAVKYVILKQEESAKQRKDREIQEEMTRKREEELKREGQNESLKLLSITEVINSYKKKDADHKKSKSVIPQTTKASLIKADAVSR